ncbi:DUF5677 domain-containing protein [Flavobacterium sp.]|uniref:DUF5677 domain-containing protein n=1 Tax=Flavobacterium sp. TaxID=239 RepID=UPI00262A5881|nr:DUF5677 domain-containing protein [Flavobacterium sp.]
MSFELPKERQIDETEHFRMFSKDIDYLTDFFSGLSDLIFFNGRIISFFSNVEHYSLSTELIESSAQTLKSIKLCCSIGSFSDANTLIRKLRDDLIQYVYILNIIGLRKPFLEESIKDLNIDNPDEFVNSFLNLQFNDSLTDDEKALTAWFKNSVSKLQRPVRKKLEFENYMKVLKQNENIHQILTEYNLQEYWETLRKRLNNYVHNNGTQFSRHNIISANDKNLETHLKNISIRTTYISSFFLILLLMVESSLISSTDYIDHLECEMQPPEDSQYFVASFVQDFIDKKVSKLHPELKQYLKDNNINGMKIE